MERTGNKPVVVIGATSRPDALDGALRRAGRLVVPSGILIAQHLKFPASRFDREIALPIPDEDAREDILRVRLARGMFTPGGALTARVMFPDSNPADAAGA